MVDLGLIASRQDLTPLVVVLDDSFYAHVLCVPLDEGVLHMLVLPVPALVHIHIEDFATSRYNINRDLVGTQVLDKSQVRLPAV